VLINEHDAPWEVVSSWPVAAKDRFTVMSPGGILEFEFRKYGDWWVAHPVSDRIVRVSLAWSPAGIVEYTRERWPDGIGTFPAECRCARTLSASRDVIQHYYQSAFQSKPPQPAADASTAAPPSPSEHTPLTEHCRSCARCRAWMEIAAMLWQLAKEHAEQSGTSAPPAEKENG